MPARPFRAQLALAALAALAGCGGGAEGGGDAQRPAAGIAPPHQVAGSYALAGRERRVRTTITPMLVTGVRRNDAIPTPRGQRQLQVDLRFDDRGPDRLDPQVLSFTAVDSGGTRVGEAFRLPIRALEADDPASPRLLSVGFTLPRGRRLSQLRLRSIVRRLPIRLRWDL
jgi:hypothetical protein